MARLALLPLCLAALALSSCGGDDAAATDGPATLAPATAAIYFEAVVRPEGDLREGVLEAFGKVSGSEDPAAEIRTLLDSALDGEDFDYARDVEPWLGERVAVWSPSLSGDEPPFALIAQATDTDQALDSLRASAERDGEQVTEGSYAGVDFIVSPEDRQQAAAIDGHLVIASKAEFERTVDAAQGDSLADAEGFEQLTGRLTEDRLATFWLDQRELFASVDTSELGPLGSVVDPESLRPVAGSVLADGSRIAVETVGAGGEAGGITDQISALASGSPELLGSLPGDAWAAFGISDLGPSATELYRSLAGALAGAAIEQEFRNQTGLDLQQDVLGWIGDVAVYASGTSVETIGGALVIEVTDADRAADAFGKLTGLAQAQSGGQVAPADIDGAESAFALEIPGAPQTLVLARSSERVVLAFGETAAAAALSPDSELSGADVWSRAGDLLGDGLEPSLLVDMGSVIEVARAFGAADDPGFTEALPYLEAFDVISVGAERDDDEQKSVVSAGLR